MALASHRRQQNPTGYFGGQQVGRALGAGEALSPPVRGFFESRLGQDLADVRIHRGPKADAAARETHAAAFTVGQDVVFADRHFAPHTSAGRALLAHELAHVVQQRRGGMGSVGANEDAAHGAERVARPSASRQSVRGGGQVMLARSPRSLHQNLEPQSLSQVELQIEIREIRRWLVENQSAAERPLLLAALERLERHTSTVPSRWHEFAGRFNDHFRSILHVFSEGPDGAPMTETPGGRMGERSGALIPAERLWVLFTERQRALLMDYFATRLIPPRLFNGDERGTTTAQQRLLMSAHMLATGRYRPGFHEQDVHARMCFHWVQLVHHYAGATPGPGPQTPGVMGSFDLHGDVVLGSGQMQTVFKRGKRVNADQLPATDSDELGLGPIDPRTAHGRALEDVRAGRRPEPRVPFHRTPSMPMKRFGELRPGDWIYTYTANASPSGAHSLIFSRFLDSSPRPASADGTPPYRTALCFSLRSDHRGREHIVRLGQHYSRDHDIQPITYVARMAPETVPASRSEDVVPLPSGRRRTALQEANERYLRSPQRRAGGPVNPALLRQWLRVQNHGFLQRLQDRLTPDQQALLAQTNEAPELEVLVGLHQRLSALVVNHEILATNQMATDDRINEQHDAAQAALDAALEAARPGLEAVDAELGPAHSQVAALESQRTALDLWPQIRALRGKLRDIRTRLEGMPRGPKRDELRAERTQLVRAVTDLVAQQRSSRSERSSLRSQIVRLRRDIRRLEARRRRIEATLTAAEREMPWSYVHPGRLQGQQAGRPTGRLQDLSVQPPWPELRVPAPDPDRPPPLIETLD